MKHPTAPPIAADVETRTQVAPVRLACSNLQQTAGHRGDVGVNMSQHMGGHRQQQQPTAPASGAAGESAATSPPPPYHAPTTTAPAPYSASHSVVCNRATPPRPFRARWARPGRQSAPRHGHPQHRAAPAPTRATRAQRALGRQQREGEAGGSSSRRSFGKVVIVQMKFALAPPIPAWVGCGTFKTSPCDPTHVFVVVQLSVSVCRAPPAVESVGLASSRWTESGC